PLAKRRSHHRNRVGSWTRVPGADGDCLELPIDFNSLTRHRGAHAREFLAVDLVNGPTRHEEPVAHLERLRPTPDDLAGDAVIVEAPLAALSADSRGCGNQQTCNKSEMHCAAIPLQ